MKANKATPKRQLKKFTVSFNVLWTAIVLGTFAWGITAENSAIIRLAETEAKSSFNKDLVYRRWAAGHGGVYVPATEHTPPNPYLKHISERDITTPSGRKLTLLNPAYMTRQVYALAAEQYGVLGHITSLNPIRPKNNADAWEKAALTQFNTGKVEISSIESIGGKPYLRYINRLITEERCLKCHAAQGYQEGDIRGGISVSVPLAPYNKVTSAFFTTYSLILSAIWFGGILLFNFGARVLGRRLDDKEQYETGLRKSKKEWEKTFDAMSDIITLQDTDMRILRANKAAHTAFQVELGALNGKYCYEVFRGTDAPCTNCPELATVKERTTHSATITHKNLGKTFNVTSSPVLNDAGELTNIVHIAKDITEQTKMEAELFQAHKMEAMGTLAGGIAHDFNNILAAILGFAELAKDKIPESNQAGKDIDQVLKAGKRAKELVRQILTFSRKSTETNGPMQASSIIKEGLKFMHASLPTTLEIQSEINSECDLILANPTNIHQILVNLCTNALHAMENEKGVLTVKLVQVDLQESDVINTAGTAAGSFVELTVSDTGCGMDEATIERIFEPYFTTKVVGKGTGMGLALTHSIVHGCGGFIRVESEPGKGSTFRVYFPSLQTTAAGVEEKNQAPLPRGTEQVLVVDDEESIVELHQGILGKLGYKVAAHYSSQEALEAFQAAPDTFDLIITDQTMPGLSGTELAKAILQIKPEMPIIICSGYSSMVSRENIKELGVKGFLMKPLSRNDLATTVREVLDQKT